MRLFLFSSIAFFLFAAMLSTNAIEVGTRDGGPIVTLSPDNPGELEQVQDASQQVPEDIKEHIDFKAEDFQTAATDSPDEEWFGVVPILCPSSLSAVIARSW